MGPKRDVVGELRNAIRNQDMRFMVALHHAENWWFFPHWVPQYDTANPEYAGLYGEAHERIGELFEHTDIEDTWPHDFFGQFATSKPSKAFLELWRNKTNEVVDKYQPDMLWFDFGLKGIQEHYKREFLAHYFNSAEKWGEDVLVTYKLHDLVPGTGMIDLELGRFNHLTYQMWLTDTTVDDGHGWGYLHDQKYKDVPTLVNYLVDNVSKNGNLLLNVGPKPNGEIPEEAKSILAGIGRWLEINGEAIYATTPWTTFGEGPSTLDNERNKARFYEGEATEEYTAQDIRFTTEGDNLYAICLGRPTHEVTIKSFNVLYPDEIKNVTMLGVDAPLQWAMRDVGLKIIPPADLPGEHAVTFKIERQHPFGAK
jgi:alpha-L-fucosidase